MTNSTRSFHHTATVTAFPLGGIGTGNISLGARGELRDWEIFNQPNKGGPLPNTFFAIRTQVADQQPVMRVLEGPVQPPHTASHGYHPLSNAGLPRVTSSTLQGEYPLVHIRFEDAKLPVQVELDAFTPFVPLDPDESGLPCAILTYTVKNLTEQPVSITLVGSFINPVGGINYDHYGSLASGGHSINEFREEGGTGNVMRGIFMHADQIPPDDPRYGNLSVAVMHPQVTCKRAWLRGAWYDFLREFWNDLSEDGQLTDLGYTFPAQDSKPDTASLGVMDILPPGCSQTYTFILTWYFPNRRNSWDNNPDKPIVRNHYAVRFQDSWAVARYIAENLSHLKSETHRFHDALFNSTLPPSLLEAVSANIVPLRSTTCFWLEDGRFFGWEGCFDKGGCCPGSCTHVWSYAYTLAYLFPSLEREMRRIEFAVETRPDGYMYFRSFQTFGDLWVWGSDTPAAVDGQTGSILRAYREWLVSGDKVWLDLVWPGIKRAIAFTAAHWDTDGDGLLDGKQHNTYDIEFYGPNPLCAIYYLAALRAVEELAGVMGEPDLAEKCRATFTSGRQRVETVLWNGSYYAQHLPNYDDYHYQVGLGCLSDQLLGQMHARILGLGDIVPVEHAGSALKAIFNHNFKHDFYEHVNCQRTYALNDEAGLILCSWPNGGQPRFPFPYSDEVWTGIEYQVAAHLIAEGYVTEGVEIVSAARARHDGVRRNPWNEVECGHHYARSMSSWALLLAASGFHCNLGWGEISFTPVLEIFTNSDYFTSFWSTGRGWGIYTQRLDPLTAEWQPSIQVLGGDMTGIRVKACGKEWIL